MRKIERLFYNIYFMGERIWEKPFLISSLGVLARWAIGKVNFSFYQYIFCQFSYYYHHFINQNASNNLHLIIFTFTDNSINNFCLNFYLNHNLSTISSTKSTTTYLQVFNFAITFITMSTLKTNYFHGNQTSLSWVQDAQQILEEEAIQRGSINIKP